MDCSQVGFWNTCELINNHYHIHYNNPFVIIAWMIFAIIIWHLKALIWNLIKWIFWFLIGLFLLALGLALASALLQTISI
jgi:ABC-type uncharacterized transport system permease subunit